MRTIKAYIETAQQRRENGEAGFSLVELIVVVVILGILAAVAIPIFAGIQDQANQSAVDAAAANAASEVAAELANPAATAGTLPAAADGFTYAWGGSLTAAPTKVDQICITVTKDGKTATKGPGC